jgi:hypothetical protein
MSTTPTPAEGCDCRMCIRERGDSFAGIPREMTEMILCATCGNKRCPHANDHRNACTNSNEPGQPEANEDYARYLWGCRRMSEQEVGDAITNTGQAN